MIHPATGQWLLALLSVLLSSTTVVRGQSAIPYSGGLSPKGIAVNPVNHYVYITGNADQNLAPFGLIAWNGSATINLIDASFCSYALDIAVNTISGTAYCACTDSTSTGYNVVSADVLGSQTVVTTTDSCANAGSIVFNTPSNTLYVACQAGTAEMGHIIALNGTANATTIADNTQCANPSSLTVNTVTSTLYALCTDANQNYQVQIINPNGQITVVVNSTQCPEPAGLAVNELTNTLFMACGSIDDPAYLLSVADGGFGVQTQLVMGSNCSSATSIDVNPIDGRIYITCLFGNVVGITGTSIEQLTTSDQCTMPDGIAVDHSSGDVYAVCSDSSTVISVLECAPGQFFSRTASPTTVCPFCPINTYQSLPAQSSCISCPPGKSTAGTGSSSADACVVCIPGTFSSPATGGTCTPCAAGTYQYLEGQGSCFNCSAGSYGLQISQTSPASCSLCPPGYQNPNVGANQIDACLPCPIGSASSSPGQAVCTTCSPGYYQSTIGQFQCQPCPAGTFLTTSGATTSDRCLRCPASTSSPPGSSSPVQCTAPICDPGLYTADSAAPCQAVCPVGSYCVNGIFSPCPAGSYNTLPKQSTCIGCGLGQFGAMPGGQSAAVCLQCPLSTYSNANASASCTLCPAETTTTGLGSTTAASCHPLSGCATGSLCPLGSSRAISTGDLLIDSEVIFAQMQLQANSSVYLDPSALYAPLRTSSSLRLAAFQSDSTLSSSSATGTTPSELSQPSPDSLSRTDIILIIVFIVIAFLPWLAYRQVPAWLARYVDQFSTKQKPEIGQVAPRHPTQFGSVVTWSFVCIGVMVAVVLGTAPNTLITTGIVPPSSTNLAGSAKANFELTIRVYSGDATIASSCGITGTGPNGFSLTGQTGFVGAYASRAMPSSSGSTCLLAADCLGCGLSGSSASVSFTLPYDAQLIEYEVWINSASPGSWSRRYGILQQQQGRLLDAQGVLDFSLSEAYYIDGSTEASGFELSYLQYESTPQSLDSFNSASQVQVIFAFQKESVLYKTVVSSKLSTLQILTVVLSALGSLFAGFAFLFSFLERHLLKRRSGRVDQDEKTGAVFVVTDSEDAILARKASRAMSRQSSRKHVLVDDQQHHADSMLQVNPLARQSRARLLDRSWSTLNEDSTAIEMTSTVPSAVPSANPTRPGSVLGGESKDATDTAHAAGGAPIASPSAIDGGGEEAVSRLSYA